MAQGKWGESFLKSGLPLEHLTQITLKSAGWRCRPHVEYQRENREKEEVWFELDLEADHPQPNNDTLLSLLVECKYHDASRFWFFMPHDPQRWAFDDRVLNPGPLQTLCNPRQSTWLALAPCSAGGIVVSEDGTKQDNAVHTAVQQLTNGFVPHCLSWHFSYNIDFNNYLGNPLHYVPTAICTIPMLVTNASVYRLKPEISDLQAIREAKTPHDIADELPWTWLYHDVSTESMIQNTRTIRDHTESEAELMYRFPFVTDRADDFSDRPNWIAVVNIRHLKEVADVLRSTFMTLETAFVRDVLKGRKRRQKKRGSD